MQATEFMKCTRLFLLVLLFGTMVGTSPAQETQTVYYEPMTKDTVKAMCSGGEIRD